MLAGFQYNAPVASIGAAVAALPIERFTGPAPESTVPCAFAMEHDAAQTSNASGVERRMGGHRKVEGVNRIHGLHRLCLACGFRRSAETG